MIKKDHTVPTLIGAATILLVLGLGNLLYGQNRLNHSQQLLSNAAQELAITNDKKHEDITGPVISLDRQAQIIKTLKSRVDFYSLVVLGGRTMLGLAGICLLGILLLRSMSGEELGGGGG